MWTIDPSLLLASVVMTTCLLIIIGAVYAIKYSTAVYIEKKNQHPVGLEDVRALVERFRKK